MQDETLQLDLFLEYAWPISIVNFDFTVYWLEICGSSNFYYLWIPVISAWLPLEVFYNHKGKMAVHWISFVFLTHKAEVQMFLRVPGLQNIAVEDYSILFFLYFRNLEYPIQRPNENKDRMLRISWIVWRTNLSDSLSSTMEFCDFCTYCPPERRFGRIDGTNKMTRQRQQTSWQLTQPIKVSLPKVMETNLCICNWIVATTPRQWGPTTKKKNIMCSTESFIRKEFFFCTCSEFL